MNRQRGIDLWIEKQIGRYGQEGRQVDWSVGRKIGKQARKNDKKEGRQGKKHRASEEIG